MKKFLFLFFSILVSTISFSTHMAGGHIEYECLGGDVYKVKFTLFRDCASAVPFEANDAKLQLKSVSCSVNCINLGFMENLQVETVDYGCGNTCVTEEYAGFEKYTVEKTITLPSECSDWMLFIEIGDRNLVDYAGTGTFFTYALINNENNVCNNSPVYTDLGVVVGCTGDLTSFQNTFTEEDGDVLVYELVSPLVGTGTSFCYSNPIVFQTGLNLTGTNPFPSVGNQFNVNSSNGNFSFVPQFPGTSYFALKVKEYRLGVLIGESLRDGMIIVENCVSASTVSFFTWQNETTNLTTIAAGSEDCISFLVGASVGEQMQNVALTGLPPSQYSYTVTGLNTALAMVSVCPIWENFEDLCEPMLIDFSAYGVCAPNACFADGSGGTGEYQFFITPIGYCPENRYFTNRNPTSGVPMPAYAKASNMIYVGDEMPVGSGIPSPQWGQVIYSQDVTLEAGVGIDIPACLLPGGDCVVLNGHNQTLAIKPNNCSPECSYEPLDVVIDKVFECELERVVPNILSGVAPYSFTWTDENGDLLSTESFLDVHEFVSEVEWDEGFEFSVYIEDIAGNYYTETNAVHGTKRFYEPVTDNTEFFDYPPSSGVFEDGWYYAGQPGVDSNRPFFISDSVNSTPPWYGATSIELSIWDRWDSNAGEILEEPNATLYHNLWDLEGTDDWSIDNAEVYWNGHWNNDLNEDCPGGFPEVWVYRVDAKNCFTTITHTELSGFVKLNCFEDDWTTEIFVTKSGIMDTTEMENNEFFGVRNADENSGYSFYPNPTNGRITIVGSMQNVSEILVYDIMGNIVLSPEVLNSEMDLSTLSSGIYTIELKTVEGLERMRVLIQK